MTTFEGRVALVTGGASGIGRATALAFVAQGARVAVADVDEAGGVETVRLAGGTDHALFVKTDVARERDVEALVAKTVAQFGRLDAAFNNAGVAQAGPRVHELPEADWDRMIDVDLKGVWLRMKHEIAHMLVHGGGAIVNTSSCLGLQAAASQSAYCAAKHGVIGLTRAAALEYAADSIRVNAICPGLTRSPMVDRALADNPDVLVSVLRAQPLPRLGEASEQAAAATWLCSDAASFVTGHAMAVDGGLTVAAF
jgi:NAD(P)-dependent dehydrogenase (short-subunit alcohol dehydrogenase family)